MTRRILVKILLPVIIVCFVGVATVQAHLGCLLACCGNCKNQYLHLESTHPVNDMHPDCSSIPKTSLCHHTLESMAVVQEFDISAELGEENLAAISLTTAATGVFLISHYQQYSAYTIKLLIKAPDVPLYYSNSSLLS